MAENLKINIGANTKDFEKGTRKVKSELRDLNRTASQTMSGIGDALGVNTGKLEQMGSALRGLGSQLEGSGNSGVAAFGRMLKGLNALKVGIAGLGLAAVVNTFKALHNEAEAFMRTAQGASLGRQLTAFVDVYKQALRDAHEETGRTMAEWETGVKQAAKTWKDTVWEGFRSGSFAAGAMGMDTTPYTKNQEKAVSLGNRAKEIAKELYDLERKRADQSRQVADIDAQIAEQKLIASDRDRTDLERLAAINQARALINQKLQLQQPVEERILEFMDEYNGLASSTPEQLDAANAQYIRMQGVIREAAQELRSLNRLSGEVTKNVEKANKERERQLALIADPLEALPAITGQAVQGTPTVALKLEPYYDQKEIIDISNEIAATLERGITSFAESVGTLLGDLIAGSNEAWSDFGDAMLTTLADLAMTVGEIAVGIGVALLGIKKGLESLQPGPMLIAGAALIALGAAAKASLKQAAAGSYSANTSSLGMANYSAGSNVAAPGYDTSVLEVHVTGELVASGNQLKAVIDNEDRRLKHTT